ncbi:glycosyltransferase [Actinosynnema sp. CA-248983]
MTTLGRELRERGHEVIIVSTVDAEHRVSAAGLDFLPVGVDEFPIGSLEEFTARQGTLTGAPAIRLIVGHLRDIARVMFRDLPDLLADLAVDGLVVDQVAPAGGTVADRLCLPFVSVCSFMPLNSERDVPPVMTPWSYLPTPLGRLRNAVGRRVEARALRPLVDLVNTARAGWGLAPVTVDGSFSGLAQIAQQPEFFDYPRRDLPAGFTYTGPFLDPKGADGPFPWDRLDGRPLVYASMGTLQNRMGWVFREIAEACAGLDVQLVLALGRADAPVPENLPGDPLVVGYAPQLALLRRADLVINHGGTNTVLECLAHGVPMVSLPVATDQFGVAARVRWLGVGEFIPVHKVKARDLRALVEHVRATPAYRRRARESARRIARLDGVRAAADVVEEAFRTNSPALCR